MKNKKLACDEPLDEAWKYWYEVILGNDRNSICQQMVRAIWDDVLFRLILEDRINNNVAGPTEWQTNQFIFEFLRRNYIDNQVSAIRRELDRYPLRGAWGVYSLHSLVKEIKSYRKSISRIKYFELLDLTYDTQNANDRERLPKFITANRRSPEHLTKTQDAALSAYMHEYFDNISRKSGDSRTPDDLISQNFFEVIESLFNEIDYIGKYCDKHVAHSAIPESRDPADRYYSTIHPLEIWSAHKKIFIIMNILSRLLTGGYLQPISMSEEIFFKNWDEPLVKSKDISLLKTTFIQYREEVNSWASPHLLEKSLADCSSH